MDVLVIRNWIMEIRKLKKLTSPHCLLSTIADGHTPLLHGLQPTEAIYS